MDERQARHKLSELHRLLAGLGPVAVAFSGGTDSAFLAFMAHQALGDQALAVTADSPSLPRAELRAARDLARSLGLLHVVVESRELQDERYAANPENRCYFCKQALIDALETVEGHASGRTLLLGVNVDDLDDFRPGQAAARERGARFPLVEVGLSKEEIRWLSREVGLPAWDKPAAACLASRLSYGVAVTPAALRRIELAEDALRRAGLGGQVRVRDQGGDLARIEVEPDDLQAVLDRHEAVVSCLREIGFVYVTLDLQGYRQGSHNESVRHLPILTGNAS